MMRRTALLLLLVGAGCGRVLPTAPAREPECAVILTWYLTGGGVKADTLPFPCDAGDR